MKHSPVRLRAGSHRRSAERVLDLLLGKIPTGGHLDLISDGHLAYRKAIDGSPRRERIRHYVYLNPSRGSKGSPRSTEARIRDRQMRPADALHSLIRHSCAHQHRETIAFVRTTHQRGRRTWFSDAHLAQLCQKGDRTEARSDHGSDGAGADTLAVELGARAGTTAISGSCFIAARMGQGLPPGLDHGVDRPQYDSPMSFRFLTQPVR